MAKDLGLGRGQPCRKGEKRNDPRQSAIAPREVGRFLVGPHQSVQVTRLFRLLEPAKRPPDGGVYERNEHPLAHDLSRCRDLVRRTGPEPQGRACRENPSVH